MAVMFGTDGVRGVANRELTPELAFKLGRAAASLLKPERGRGSIVIGRDTRHSGPMLEGALLAGICSAGLDVYLAGVIPTPAIAFLTRELEACAGAVISASHNPAPDNGIKFFNHKGFKLDDELEEKIEALVLGDLEGLPRPTGADLGKVIPLPDAVERYVNFLKNIVKGDLTGLKIVVDCANGAAYQAAPILLRRLGAEVIILNNEPDGININDECGSTHPAGLQKAVLEHKAHLGLAYDGDADRVIAVDEKGELVDGDKILVICGLNLHEKNKLGKKIVVTVMSNWGLKQAFHKEKVEVLETKVGDRFVLEKMLESGAVLGGEQSGHIIFLKHNTTGDGILTSLQLLQVLKEKGQPLSTLAQAMETYPQVLRNVKVKSKQGWEKNSAIQEAIARGENTLSGSGRILVRPSGTEPLIRVMAEGKDRTQLETVVNLISDVIEKELG
ncbi:MAG: phosphoglucosamine mutase [Peptococcaceae bacterium]|jgi:phosphoglucosamine mutase|uniref:Phosphoglucosamine mutase n=1 Tax=Thermanaerosceptrum fracticalcis TaxID=1712410 RepID=A0A7G6E3D8_THEFR|nr:phosphoglucosamine mutase [Thermanaerosceptrum fracticalcis]MBZ4654964.1 phosphoglucosamine mutase [Peptococcaceae bacterium]QNB46592.1 phosphoglucosamine mutase [Thermanaerosceptrum fracticalcis]